MHVCMQVCRYVYTYVCIYVSMFASVCACIYICIDAHIHICMYICAHKCICIHIYIYVHYIYIYTYSIYRYCMYITCKCIVYVNISYVHVWTCYVCMYVCMYVIYLSWTLPKSVVPHPLRWIVLRCYVQKQGIGKWVVSYRLQIFSQRFEHTLSTPHQYSFPLILSVTHMILYKQETLSLVANTWNRPW